MLLLSTYFDYTNLLTTLHHWCEDSLIHCISAPESAAINVVQFVENTQYTTSKQDSGQLGGPRRNIAIRFVTEKPPKQCGYMTTKKVWEYVYSFRHNTWIWQTSDGHHTTAKVAHAWLQSCGKNCADCVPTYLSFMIQNVSKWIKIYWNHLKYGVS